MKTFDKKHEWNENFYVESMQEMKTFAKKTVRNENFRQKACTE